MYKLLLICCLLLTVSFKPEVKVVKKAPPKVKELKQVKAAKVYHTQYDSSKVTVRVFNAAAIYKYRSSPEFNYDEKGKVSLSWWKRFWIWIWELIEKLFGGPSTSSGPSFPFMEYLIVAIAVGLLIFVVVKMVGLNIANIFNRKPKDIDIPYTESLENIHQITFEEEIEKALNQRNYRLAIRLLYLSTLKQLNDAQLIQWQIEKTNSAYLRELTNAEQRQSFGVLTRQFEYVWYGDFPVDGPSFQNINTLFHDFKNMLK
jgi:hypothetical protein